MTSSSRPTTGRSRGFASAPRVCRASPTSRPTSTRSATSSRSPGSRTTPASPIPRPSSSRAPRAWTTSSTRSGFPSSSRRRPPRSSSTAGVHAHAGAVLVTTPDGLRDAAGDVRDAGLTPIAQRPAERAEKIDVALVRREGRSEVRLAYRVVRDVPLTGGLAVTLETVPSATGSGRDAIEALERVCAAAGYDGIANGEFCVGADGTADADRGQRASVGVDVVRGAARSARRRAVRSARRGNRAAAAGPAASPPPVPPCDRASCSGHRCTTASLHGSPSSSRARGRGTCSSTTTSAIHGRSCATQRAAAAGAAERGQPLVCDNGRSGRGSGRPSCGRTRCVDSRTRSGRIEA